MSSNEQRPNKTSSVSIFFVGIFLMIGLVVAGFAIKSGLNSLSKNSTITVKGSASKNIESDKAVWHGRLSYLGSSQAEGYQTMQNQKEQVLDYLSENGFDRKNIKVDHLEYYENIVYSNGNPVRNGYRFNQSFTIESNDIDKIEALADKSSELLLKGLNFESSAPEYLYTKLNNLKVEMISKATADAKIRADEIAKNGGDKIGGISSAQQGVFQITPINSNEVFDWGMNDVSSRKKTITSVVTVTYFIEK